MRRNYVALLIWGAITGTSLLTGLVLVFFPALQALALAGGLVLSVVLAWMFGRRLHRDADRMEAAVRRLPEFDRRQPGPSLPEFGGIAATTEETSRRLAAALAGVGEDRRQLEALLDSMQDAVVAVDAAGRIQWTNQPMQRLLPGRAYSDGGRAGRVRVGHALVQTIRDPEVLECVRLALDGEEGSVRRATTLLPGRIFEVNASPMPGGGAVAVLHDVTRIEQVERTQRDFVANVSHELRTPLTSISGYVETLLDHEPLSEQAREFLATILKNAGRMTRLTEDLLVMARVEAPELAMHPAALPVADLIGDAMRGMSGLALDQGATLETETVPDCDVIADHDAVMQVLGNLIENAIKYGRPRGGGPARVVVGARLVEEPFAAVEFSVRDFGQGIGSEHLARIFERFYRVDKTRSRESGGTGLGLAIARHMVHSQGGIIWAESELGTGSRFLFLLPSASPAVSLEDGGKVVSAEIFHR